MRLTVLTYQCEGGPCDGQLVPVVFPVNAWCFRTADPLKVEVYQFKNERGRWRLMYAGKMDVAKAIESAGDAT